MTPSTKRTMLWGSVIVGIVALVVLLASFGSGGSGAGVGTALGEPVSADDHTKGADNARVTIVEYSDFQCPACASFYPIVKQVVAAYPDDVAFVYRHYPLRSIHPHAQLSGQAAEAAAIQGQFWEMHDVLFNTQNQWTTLADPTDFFVRLAESLGLNVEQFQTDLTSDTVVDRVNDDFARATALRLSGTPSFFVNGTLIQNPNSYAAFTALIDTALAQ